jgi:hypothetical protein
VYPTFWHLAAYFASLTNGSTFAQVAAVNDGVLTRTTANNFILPKPGKIVGAYSAGVSITEARINTPSLRYVGLPLIGFLNAALVVPSPPALTWWGDNGPPIPTVDEISIEHSLGGAAPENEFTLLFIQFEKRPVPAGPTYRLEFTGTITASAGTWVSGAMTPTSTLPQGSYAVVGMDCVGTNLAAARLIFPGSFFRPGCLCRNSKTSLPSYLFTNDSMGLYGTFKSVNLPNLEVFSIGANTAQTVYLDVIRTGDWTP